MTLRRNAAVLALAMALPCLTGTAISPAHAGISMTDPDAHVLCPAFHRSGHGIWTATAPITLDFDNGTSMRISPGQTFPPNGTTGGIEVSAVLDRQCGNT